MDMPDSERIKHREIAFQKVHPDPHQAHSAARFLADIEGLLAIEPTAPHLLRISYDVLAVSLKDIEDALQELGLHLDTHIIFRIKRALIYYTEETLRANCGCPAGTSNCTDKIFAARYQMIEHGCRDHRPEHWRRYL